MTTKRQRFGTVREIEAWKPKQNNDTKSISFCQGLYVRGQLTVSVRSDCGCFIQR